MVKSVCGAFDTINNPFTNSITEALAVSEVETRGIRAPASMIQIVTEDENDRYLEDARWWLLLGKDGKPNYKYSTFNSRYDKLYTSPLTKELFKPRDASFLHLELLRVRIRNITTSHQNAAQ